MAPVVTPISPTVGTIIDVDQELTIDVTSVAGFSALLIAVSYVGFGVAELAYDGAQFTGPYSPTSSATAIVNGFRFVFRRSPAWPDSPAVTVFAVDTAGAATTGVAQWLLIDAPPAATTPATQPVFPIGAGPGTCPAPLHNQEYFLTVLDQFFPSDYVDGLKAGDGYELFQAFAKIGERLSAAVEHFECGSFFLTATGGSFSSGGVEFYRSNASAGEYVLQPGTIVKTSLTGRTYKTTSAVTFGVGDLGPHTATISAVWQAWEWNVAGQQITLRGETIAGNIDTIVLPVTTASANSIVPVIDGSLRVRQLVDTSGGAAPMLDALGQDRGLPRNPGESDPEYRLRLRTLPDTVSPGAIQRLVRHLFAPYNATPEFIELFDIAFQTCWNAPVAMPINPAYDPTTFVWSDPRPPPPHAPPQFRNRWLDSVIVNGAFVVVIPRLQPISMFGLAWNDPATSVADLASADFENGERAIPAWNLPIGQELGLTGAWNGIDTGFAALALNTYQSLQKIKAGGVAAIVEVATA